jgi:hypothetical protein
MFTVKSIVPAVSAAALALSACTHAPSPGGMAMGGLAGGDFPQAAPAARAGAAPIPLGAMPTTVCIAPTPGAVTIRRGETMQRGSMQIHYTGRDESFRTDPYVYMFESNATLINGSNTVRNASFFGLWRGQAQTAVACGRTVHLSLVNASADSATINVRPVS